MSALLELSNVARGYRDGHTTLWALSDLNLEVHPGEILAVMGPSGSGKTTLLNVCAGRERPDRGSVHLLGSPLDYSTAAIAKRLREIVAVVYQQGNLLRDLTALENVALPLQLIGMRTGDALARAREELELVGLTANADQLPDRLSGGERQRVAMARALIGGRRLILADEPTGALETTSAEHVMRVLRERTGTERGAIVATHDQRLAGYADRVIYMRDGRIVGQVDAAAPVGLDS